jgi:hypothetical protein
VIVLTGFMVMLCQTYYFNSEYRENAKGSNLKKTSVRVCKLDSRVKREHFPE